MPSSKFSCAFGPFNVFRLFHMDYVTRQFVNLAKKFRKELPKLSELLHRDIEQHTKAIHAAQKGNENQRDIQPLSSNQFFPSIKRRYEIRRQARIVNIAYKIRYVGLLGLLSSLPVFMLLSLSFN